LPPNQAWRCEEVLIRLAGDAAPAVSLGRDSESSQRCRDEWSKWWSQNSATIDLAKLDAAPATLGLTLIVELDMRPTKGRVYEIDANKKVVWKIEVGRQVYDAVVVGKDRVLIAERGDSASYQVSCRDFKGEVLWTKNLSAMPMSLQVLPQGGVLVFSRNQILEFDMIAPNQPDKFILQRDRIDLVAAAKDKNGEYVALTTAGQVLRIDAQKNERGTFRIDVRPSYMGGMQLLPNGKMLVAHAGGVSEFAPDGSKEWTVDIPAQATSVQRLANGNTLVTAANDRKVIELDRRGSTVWEYSPADNAMPRRARQR